MRLAFSLALALALALTSVSDATATQAQIRGKKPGPPAETFPSPFGGCRVASVSSSPPPEPGLDAVSHGGDPIQLVDADATHLSCVDARAARNVVASPAGDIGEFLMGVEAYRVVCRANGNVTESEVLALMRDFVTKHAQPLRPFYMHTADAELTRLLTKLKLDVFPKTRPANLAKWWSVLFNTTDRVHGCGHVWYQLKDPAEYKMRRDVIESSLKAFFTLMWDPVLNASMRYEVVHGVFDAWGVVTVKTSVGDESKRRALRGSSASASASCAENCEDKTPILVPRLRPKGAPADNALQYRVSKTGMLDPEKDVFAFHASAAERFRTKILAPFFASKCPVPPKKGKKKPTVDHAEAILEYVTELAGHQLTETIHHLESSFNRTLKPFTIEMRLENAAP